MARQVVQPWFRRDDYETIRKLVPDAPDIASHTFEHWEQQANKEFARLEALGFQVVKVLVDPSEFTNWCKDSRQRHDFLSLTAFAMKIATDMKDS